MATQVSRKLIKSWTDTVKVGIYDSQWTLRLYADRAVLRMPYVKWVGNSGGYAEQTSRITGEDLQELLLIATQEGADDADYTERVKGIIWDM